MYSIGSGIRSGRCLAGAVALLACALLPGVAAAAPKFDGGPVPLERKRAYDIGVADFDRDGRLDLFSANHMFRDSLLRGDGRGGFEDAYHSAGYSPNPGIPGIEELGRSPEIDEPGVYLWMKTGSRRPNIRIAAHELGRLGLPGGTASGRLRVAFPKVKVRRRSNAEVEVERKGRTRTVIRFELGRSGRITLRPNHIDLPYELRLGKELPLASAFLGARAVPASSRRTTIALGDRHGVAWADLDGRGGTDAFITNGGLSGRQKELPRLGGHELLLSRGGALTDALAGSGLRKASCRGREAHVVDFDDDGTLDLFAGCRQGRPRLYRGRGDGSFRELRRATRAIGNRGTISRWVDLDADGDPELIRAGKFAVEVYAVRRSGRARLRQRLRTPNDDKNVEALAPGDFDADGDPDLFLAAPSDNAMLVNRGGRLLARDPARLGLPRRHGVAASWVDYDNDSRLDLYVSPDGLFRNVGGRFRSVGALRSPGSPRFARASWFDADGDGRRDLVRLTQRGTGLFPQVRMFRNRTAGRNHWLEIDLVGSRGNREAIGARVELRAGKRRLTGWVGESEGSRFGQGHYRLYFGLGRRKAARRVVVRWPGGGKSRLGRVRGDRLITVRR